VLSAGTLSDRAPLPSALLCGTPALTSGDLQLSTEAV